MSARANVCVFSIICRCIQIAILYCTIGTKNNRVAIVFPPVSRRKVSCNKQPNRFCRASRAAACHVRYGWSSIASSPSLLDRRAAMLPDSDISGIQQMTALPLFLSLILFSLPHSISPLLLFLPPLSISSSNVSSTGSRNVGLRRGLVPTISSERFPITRLSFDFLHSGASLVWGRHPI